MSVGDGAVTLRLQVGDGTTTVVLLAGEFLKAAKPFVEDGVHPQVLCMPPSSSPAAASGKETVLLESNM